MFSNLIIIGGVAVAYLIGGIPVGVLAGRARGMDIRRYGSGNIGASNVLRTLGVKAGLLVWGADVLKGLLPVAGAMLIASKLSVDKPELWISLVAVAAVGGHCFSPYLRLGGGRGVSTSLGAMLAIDWRVGLSILALWLMAVAATRYISLGSIVAAAATPPLIVLYGNSRYYLGLGVALAIILIIRHRPNIERLLAGTETKIGQKAKKVTHETDDD